MLLKKKLAPYLIKGNRTPQFRHSCEGRNPAFFKPFLRPKLDPCLRKGDGIGWKIQ
jgi:hypothetical protein